MAFTHQMTTGGSILRTDAGDIQGECCCGGNPCDPDPSMVITVTAIDANLPVTWCGITWVKSTTSPLGVNDRYSGQSAEVCPTFYNKSRSSYTTTMSRVRKFGAEGWEWGTANQHSLNMQRQFLEYLWAGSCTYAFNINQLFIAQSYDSITFACGGNSPNTLKSDLQLITAVSAATYSSYSLTAPYFSSHTVGGVTYAWEKGAGWP